MPAAFPFSAIVGQDEMKLAILVAAVDPRIGGVLVFGDRGTGKSTAVRALAALLPPMRAVVGCRYACDPADTASRCEDCAALKAKARPKTHLVPVPVVDLPLGATEDRVVGALDLERALTQGDKAFEPGLLARAHRGFLYIDEVNLLEDHLVDLLHRRGRVGRERGRARGPERAPPGALRAGRQRQPRGRANCVRNCSTASAWRWRCARRPTSRSACWWCAAATHSRPTPQAFVDEWHGEDERVRKRIVAARKHLHEVKVADAASSARPRCAWRWAPTGCAAS